MIFCERVRDCFVTSFLTMTIHSIMYSMIPKRTTIVGSVIARNEVTKQSQLIKNEIS